VSQHELSSLEKRYVKGVYPDLTLIAYIPEDIFEITMKLRSIPSKSDHLRSKTLWDKSDIIAHLQRQKYYLQLPELFRKQKIRRKFALLDASLTPADVIIESINLCALVFARKNICSVRSLMSTATALTKKNRSEVLYGLIKGRTNSKKSRKIDL
jgi:hypothetical protein